MAVPDPMRKLHLLGAMRNILADVGKATTQDEIGIRIRSRAMRTFRNRGTAALKAQVSIQPSARLGRCSGIRALPALGGRFIAADDGRGDDHRSDR